LPFSYVFKRLIRSWQLYIALLLGIILASVFFAGINVGADTAAKQALDQALSHVPVDLYASAYSFVLSSSNITDIAYKVSKVDGVNDVEAISRVSSFSHDKLDDANVNYKGFRIVGISNKSHVYDGWIGGVPSWEENKTYIWADSSDADLWEVGSVISLNITMPFLRYENFTEVKLPINLTVAGFVSLEDKAVSMLQGTYSYIQPFGIGGPTQFVTLAPIPENLLIVSWEKTLTPLLDTVYELSPSYSPISTDILVFVDRNSLVSVWDIPGSIQRLNVVKNHIDNEVGRYGIYTYSMLDSILTMYNVTLSLMRLSFIVVSLPVFFVAWYMGTTVSDVSFNLRRREIGLLLTKGFSRRQLLQMFLSEALLIGVAGGFIGFVLSLALNPLFVRAVGGEFAGTPIFGIDTTVLTVVFSAVITMLAVFRPARRASNLAPVDALREYMYVEEVKPYKKLWPWVAFILGSYKMVIFLTGVNLMTEVQRLAMTGGNFLLIILVGVWAFFDVVVLTYIGPVLFFWGFTKIFIRGSLKFQEITAKAAKFLGDLGVLATRSVQRNPARAASIAFLIALIIGYGVQITGTLASEQDYNIRVAYANVGADVRVELGSSVNVSSIRNLMNTIRNNVSGVASTTVEYSFYGTSSFGGLQLTTVNTTDWLNTAYYEGGWFSGNDLDTAFQHLSLDNHTIILDRDVAERNNLNVGDEIRVGFSWEKFEGEHFSEDLTIVGFFGVKRPESPIFGPVEIYTSRSYVPEGWFHELSQAIANSSSAIVLVKLDSGTDGATVANQIRTLAPRKTVYSVAEQLHQQQSNLMYTGILNVQRLGVAFAILAASIGTALVTLVSLKERQREASIMSVRGLSFKQLTVMLLTENLAVVTFAVLIGAIAGLIIVYGNVVSFSSTAPSFVAKRLVFPPDALLTIFTYLGLVFASTIVPVIFMAKRYISRLERVVRQV